MGKPRTIDKVKRVQNDNSGESKTKQSMAEATNINLIMKKYERTGLIEHVNEAKAAYADVSNIVDYKSARDYVDSAMKEFMDLPSKVRQKFKNNPQELIEFLGNQDNYDEAVDLGLIEKSQEAPQETPPQVSNEAKADESKAEA